MSSESDLNSFTTAKRFLQVPVVWLLHPEFCSWVISEIWWENIILSHIITPLLLQTRKPKNQHESAMRENHKWKDLFVPTLFLQWNHHFWIPTTASTALHLQGLHHRILTAFARPPSLLSTLRTCSNRLNRIQQDQSQWLDATDATEAEEKEKAENRRVSCSFNTHRNQKNMSKFINASIHRTQIMNLQLLCFIFFAPSQVQVWRGQNWITLMSVGFNWQEQLANQKKRRTGLGSACFLTRLVLPCLASISSLLLWDLSYHVISCHVLSSLAFLAHSIPQYSYSMVTFSQHWFLNDSHVSPCFCQLSSAEGEGEIVVDAAPPGNPDEPSNTQHAKR